VRPLQSATPAEAAIGGNVYSESLVGGRWVRDGIVMFLLDGNFVIGVHLERKALVVEMRGAMKEVR
jgi:uncharacterized membrane protein